MISKHRPKKSKSRSAEFLQKPQGVIHPRVQKVGPEHFGIVSVDCAKARSKWMLTDFYGKVLLAPTEVAHNHVDLEATVARVRDALSQYGVLDCLVAVERTGRYHHPIKNAFAKAGFETRLVHPFATKQFRQPADPGNKTDDTDLAAIQRAAVNGFALLEKAPVESWRQLHLCIISLERDIAHRLAQTPYILLMSFPGINVVSAADFAGEMGPIGNYANARAITGRAGLFPSRHQSDRVDRPNGPLVRRANRALRAAILGIADNLILCNQHFRALAAQWKAAGKDPRASHVRVASRFCRIAFHMVAGQQVYRHPSQKERNYVLDKLLAFHHEHETSWEPTLRDLNLALDQVPAKEHAAEAQPLLERQRAAQKQTKRNAGKTGPQPLHELLAIVLARLGVGALPSRPSGLEGPN